MGTKISIDKHVSNLDDILEMSPSYFDKIKFESKIAPSITQHLKVIISILESPFYNTFILFYTSCLFEILYRFGNSAKIKENLIVWKRLPSHCTIFNKVAFISHLKKHIYCFWYINLELKVIFAILICFPF
jgi:hypothetical protein